MVICPHRVDSIEIITLVDNVIEILSSKPHDNFVPVRQWVTAKNASPNYLFGGHGFSTLIRIKHREKIYSVLYDTGPSGDILIHNVVSLGLDTSSIGTIVISHGHWDHMGGLLSILARIGHPKTPVYLHPRMLVKRRIATKTEQGEHIRELPYVCTANDITEAGGNPILTTEPTLIAGNTILRSGEIPRQTEYEKGFPNHQALIDNEWRNDSEIIDDNCLILRTKEGLIIITGCAHSGIVNSIYEAIRLTGVNKVHAIIGGFHLGGEQDIPRIEHTIRDLQAISPSMIVPCHCTSTPAQHLIASAFSRAYVTSSVGNMYKF
ncbi:MAG: MBL fold metallo-hydrolase [Candidatus Odinarchaeota archaeon]